MHTARLLFLCLMLAACKEGAPPPASAVAPPDPSPSHSSLPSPAHVAGGAETAALKLALDGEGLRIFNTVSGASRLVPFGISRADVVNAVSAAQKARPLLQGDNLACRAAYASWPSGLTAFFAKDRFAGWSAVHADPALTTASGIGVGSTRADLEGSYQILVTASGHGTEFTAGALAGRLDAGGPDARVTALRAGLACNEP